MAFLPSTEISDTFYELFSIAPDNQNISAFSDYILANFIENDSRYPPHLWAEPPSNDPRTINGPESYHRHLKDQFYNSHPSIYDLRLWVIYFCAFGLRLGHILHLWATPNNLLSSTHI